MDIGLQQDKKNEIYQKTEPPYEDLFDPAEEYILTLLLVPWMKMVEVDKSIYGKVELVEESRQLDSVYFRKLQALHQESVSKKDESIVPEVSPLPQPDVLREAQLLSEVPEEYRGWSLHDLIRNGLELEQFRLFLEEHSAVYVCCSSVISALKMPIVFYGSFGYVRVTGLQSIHFFENDMYALK